MGESYFRNNDKIRVNILLVILFILLFIVIILLVYFNSNTIYKNENKNLIEENLYGNINETNLLINNTKETRLPPKHIPINLSEDDILVSFRVDDMTFEAYQKPVLEKLLYLARKYNITFDLAVIAKTFDEKADPDTFKIYLDNQDVFEVVAHGYTHTNPINESSHGGEFYDSINKQITPVAIQENHIISMINIFKEHNLTMGTKILLTPVHAGDKDTVKLAEKYGYKLITQLNTPNNQLEYIEGNIVVSRVMIDSSYDREINDKDIIKIKNDFLNYLKNNKARIQIIIHITDFTILSKFNAPEKIIDELKKLSQDNNKIKFGMISERIQ